MNFRPFEVVSVRQYKGPEHLPRHFQTTADGVVVEGLTLKYLIFFAYAFPWDSILGGPSWVNETGFSIQAKVADSDVNTLKSLKPVERNQMLRPVLEDRFHLQVHVESRTAPIFELVVAKGGPKIKPLPTAFANSQDDPTKKPRVVLSRNQIKAEAVPIKSLTGALSSAVGNKVVDKTGLQGSYDFTLHWSPEETDMTANPANVDMYPSIYGALKEQLGLELIKTEGPIDVLIIDHAEMPSSN